MPSKQSQKPRGRVKSSIVLRLNLRLFLRLLGIYVFMDLLLLLLTGEASCSGPTGSVPMCPPWWRSAVCPLPRPPSGWPPGTIPCPH